jgi:NitT/TauT family transport system substrate-binding protein
LNPIILQEPFRALFYAPFYAAMARGDYEREGVTVTLTTEGDPDRAAANLLAGMADMAWGGPMRVIRDHARDPASPLVSFGAVVMRDPFVLIGRGARPGFSLRELSSLSLGVVSEVPTPWWCLRHDLVALGIAPDALNLVTGRDMRANMEAVLAGTLDVAQVLEPYASLAEARGGAVWHAQASRGPTSYTAFYATRDTLAAMRDTMRAMLRGLAAMQRWLHAAPADEIADTVARYFPDTDRIVLVSAITRYRSLSIWSTKPRLPRDAFDTLQAAMLNAGAITYAPGFDDCVDNTIVTEDLA